MELKAGNRVEYIDALRGMTMILVVYSHVALWCFDNLNMAYNDVFMKFRMPTFFFISGWVFFKVDRIWNNDTEYPEKEIHGTNHTFHLFHAIVYVFV